MSISNNDNNFAISVDNVSKKYCRNLKRSLRYGLKDLFAEFTGQSGKTREKLRPGEFFAIDHISFQMKPGECVALLGPNGAGKSTLLKMLAGLFKPDTGRIAIRGRLGALIELGTGFNPVLSGRENVFVNGTLLGLSRQEIRNRFDEIVEFAEVGHVIDEPVRTYSSGMRLRLGFGVAAHLRPQVLLIDEVLAVGDVGFRMKCFKHLLNLIEDGLALIVVSHAVGQLNRVATRAIVLHEHKMLFDGGFPEGAALYEKIMIDEKPQGKQPKKSSVVSLKGIRVINVEDGGNQFQTGQTLRGEIDIESTELVKDVRARVFIESPRTGVLGGFSTRLQDFRFDLEPPGKTLIVEMPDLPLLMGAYTLNVGVFGPEIEDFLDRRQPGASFEVIGPQVNTFGYGEDGTLRFQHNWDMTTLE